MDPKPLVAEYVRQLAEVARHGDAREESYYPAFGTFIKQMADAHGLTGIVVVQQPRPTESGNPDFRVWDGRERIIGYIEAKAPEKELLDPVEDTEQLQRYIKTFPNLILTNFLEFRLYRNGQRVQTASLGRSVVLHRLKAAPPLENIQQVCQLFEAFLGFSPQRVLSAKDLAAELAKRCSFLRAIVFQQLAEEKTARANGRLTGFYDAFKQFLMGDLAEDTFADLYAQTITYGLFAARTRTANSFSRRTAFENIPHTVGVLRDLFRYISLEDPPPQLEWIVDDIAHVLAVADVRGILDEYYRQHKGQDPIVHFYETFLEIYNPAERERRGVYYTPEPIVDYIVRGLHHLLKDRFNLQDGLAAREVTLLDPAAGTMTFVARAAQLAVAEFKQKYGTGAIGAFVRDHILRDFYAFELMVAPYAVGHLKMGFYLEELGHRVTETERIPFYLTNTLDMSELDQSRLPGLSSLAEESRRAGRVKRQQPILVILGNPPYSGHSANQGAWIRNLINDYKQVAGQPLGEKNPKWLQDDYVKFIRFAEWKIAQAGCGVVGMITNHSYLDNPTFRGMRWHLMQTFDEIYVLDLHGNALKREVCPDGSPDENVFDIRQGVAIVFLVKRRQKAGPGKCVLHHAELWGKREAKYRWLRTHEFTNTRWKRLGPKPEFYLFIPRTGTGLDVYESFIRLTDIFEVCSVGIVTARDNLTIRWTPHEMWTTVLNFSKMDPELARRAYELGTKVPTNRIKQAQQDLLKTGPSRDRIVPILYRPFDVRYTYYTGKHNGFHERPRPEVMRHMLSGRNIALITPRRVEHVGSWQHAFVSNIVSEHVAVSLKTIDYHFPLYLYPGASRQDDRPDYVGGGGLMLFEPPAPYDERKHTLDPTLVDALAVAYGAKPASENILHYIYAVLYTPLYRQKYADSLRRDFPRIPFPRAKGVFAKIAKLGQKLVELHLLSAHALGRPTAKFHGHGDNKVAKGRQGIRYDPATKRVYINSAQYFAPVPPEVWEYRIGAYQVCEKWLKDRTERTLSLDEIQTYLKIVTALARTLAAQHELDALYPAVEADLLKVK